MHLNNKNITVIQLNESKNINIDNFSIARNFILNDTKSPWVLVIDSDEELTPELENAIPELIKNATVDGFWFRRRYMVDNKWYLRYGLFYPDWQLRLFRADKGYKYHGAVHEELDIPKIRTSYIPHDILHHQKPPKLDSWKRINYLSPYMEISYKELRKEFSGNNFHNRLILLSRILNRILHMFVFPMTRGKGFLDGYKGFRAHALITWSVIEPMLRVMFSYE